VPLLGAAKRVLRALSLGGLALLTVDGAPDHYARHCAEGGEDQPEEAQRLLAHHMYGTRRGDLKRERGSVGDCAHGD